MSWLRTQAGARQPVLVSHSDVTLTRDPLLIPFASSSAWLRSIGAGAVLGISGLKASPSSAPKLKTDEIFVGMNPSDPLLKLDDTNLVAGVDKGTANLIPSGTLVHVPAGISHGGTMNGIAAFLDQDGRTVWHVMPVYLRDGTVSSSTDTGANAGPRARYVYPRPPNLTDIYGDGLAGSHGASHLGGLGGCLRAWEWADTGPIQHVMAVNVYSPKYLSQTSGGYRWPATKADGGYTTVGGNNYYGGSIPDMRMGSLLCLPAGTTAARVTAGLLTDAQALRFAQAWEDYGLYVVDASGVNEFYAISAETTVVDDIAAAGSAFHAQVLALMPLLKVVTNNGPTAVGGGGTPRVAPLPDIAP